MPILGTEALALASSHDAAILAHAAQDGVCICTQLCFQDLFPGHAGAIADMQIEGTPIRVALPGAIAGRTVQ
jgi:hypothetical protein